MASTWQKTQEFYNWVLESEVTLCLFVVALKSFCMHQWKPLNLRGLLIAYNIAMMTLSDYVFEEVFFILCKKQKQVTFLRLYHHATVLFNWCSWVKYAPGRQGYYILVSPGPQMNHYLWQKHYLSIMQLSQFVATAAHSSYNLFTECLSPDGFNTAVLYVLSLTTLFLYFYY